MRNPWRKRIVGIVAFALPALMSVVGMRLDRLSFGHDPAYARLIPPVMWASLLVAVIVPAAFVMTSSLSLRKRVALTASILCLLAIECVLVVYIGLLSALH